jgi:hypothetical protein
VVRNSTCYFLPGKTDPVEYDFSALRYLISVGQQAVEPTIAALQQPKYQFPSMQVLDADAFDIELIYRQCLPASCIGVRLGLPIAEISRYLYLFSTCQTSILNHIDRHLDLSRSHTLRDPALLLADVHAVMCYAVAQLYSGMQNLSYSGDGPAALSEMSAVSEFIIQSMYDNYATRFNVELLRNPGLVLSAYKDPIRSRHLGSGFYSSSIRGLYAYFRIAIPDSLNSILLDMRRLRQRVDELCDLFEDTATGLINYPVALLLSVADYRARAVGLITAMWDQCKQVIGPRASDAGGTSLALLADPALQHMHSALLQMLEESGALSKCYAEASDLWTDIRSRASCTMPEPIADVIRVVVDLKRALLERIAQSNWDDQIGHTFFDIQAEDMGTSRE